MTERTLAGETIYSTLEWLNAVGAPTPTGRANDWRYATVERLLRHPILAGMTPFNPGNSDRRRGDDALRDENGPVVNEALAVLTVEDWRAMLALLDNRQSPQARPRDPRNTTSSLLSASYAAGTATASECTGAEPKVASRTSARRASRPSATSRTS